MEASKQIEILLVEDDLGDINLIREVWKESGPRLNLNMVDDGVKALQYLRKKPPYETVSRPDLILLDLNLPKKDGRELLEEIKKDEALKPIPVVVFSTSDAESDILKSYLSGANCFITKPLGLAPFTKVMKGIQEFWFNVAKLPPE